MISKGSGSAEVRRKKRIVGLVAIVLLVVFLILSFPPLRVFNLIEWLTAALLVALVANFIFRRLDRQQNK
jgi:di/tricarboxylate transporter